MNPENSKDATDNSLDERWLDDALARYGSAQPRLGIEARILAGIQAHAAQRQRRWIYAFAAAAAVMLFAVVLTSVWTRKSTGSPSIGAETPSKVISNGATPRTDAQREDSSFRPVPQPHALAHKNATNSTVLRAATVKLAPSMQTDLTAATTMREVELAPVRSMPDLYVSNLRTIESIEIRELPTTKDRN